MRMLSPRDAGYLGIIGLCGSLLAACQPAPPAAQRTVVELPVITGDHGLGRQVYDRECSQCHQLTAGRNSKAPQLERIYGAPAAALVDYQNRYSVALLQSGWTWDAATLDRYLADPAQALPEGKMLSDPLPDPTERQAVIAYLSTIR